MEITLLCNAGLAVAHRGVTLLVDVLNGDIAPFHALSEELWQKILNHEPPFSSICGLCFTHDHPDHYNRDRVDAYLARWPGTPFFLPHSHTEQGTALMGPFSICYGSICHAPMEEETPPHAVIWITNGDQSVYVAADAKPDPGEHIKFLQNKRADAAFWNAMYLSQPQTRQLLRDVAVHSYIYHMPAENPDGYGLWNKCRRNLSRYGSELENVTVLDRYPCTVTI